MKRVLTWMLALMLVVMAVGCTGKKSDEPVKRTDSFFSRDQMPRPTK